MFDKNQDTFFDENKGTNKATDELMHLLNTYDKKITTDLKPGTQVEGIITRIGSEYLFIDIGCKNEALIKKSELLDENKNCTSNIGDTVKAYIISNSANETILSKRLGGQSAAKEDLFNAFKNHIPVQGKVTGVSKDGLNVKILGYRAFCPISQIDIKFTEDVNLFLAKTLEFVITRITEGGKNIIVSRIPLLEQDLSEKISALEKLVDTQTVIHGSITKISDFGLFVDIGSIEGLVHISECSWEHIDNLSDLFSPGQEVDCIILQVVRKKPLKQSKISLSIKQLFDNPWNSIKTKFSCGQSVNGKVMRLTNFGAFIELLPGVDGLVHISEMSWLKKIQHPSEVLTVGTFVNVTILSIDETKKTISLSLKDLSNDPWHDAQERFPVGIEMTGNVVKKSRYGYFIDLCEGVTGLLVFSNIISDKREAIKEGDSIQVVIESVDPVNRRISLSHGKQETRHNQEAVSEYLKNAPSQKSPTNSSTEFGAALFAALKNKQ